MEWVGRILPQENRLTKTRRKMQIINHPKKGSSIKVDPIRNMSAIQDIKDLLQDQPRNMCLFTLGINTAYRASELLSLKVGDVTHLKVGDVIEIKQMKNHKYRQATLNGVSYKALQHWLAVHPTQLPNSALFMSQRGGVIGVSYMCQLMKSWCKQVGLNGNYGSHSLRKTWGYHQRTMNRENADVSLLMRAYGHASETQTLAYLGIQPKEIKSLYLDIEL